MTVRAGEDADAVTGTHASSGADYGTVAAAELAFTVNDDETAGIKVDTAPGTVGVQTGRLVVTEEDATLRQAAYTVVLTAQPVGGAVTVGVGSGDASAVTVAPAALVFSMTNWNTARTVTARAVTDADDDGEDVTVTHTVSGTADATSYPTTLAAVTVQVTARDDDRRVWTNTALSFDVPTTVLFTYTMPAQSVVVQVPGAQNWNARRIVACAWTAVEPVPVQNTAVPAGCTVINDRPSVNAMTLSSPITSTQAMRDNGGVVIGMTNALTQFAYRFFYTEWVPLAAPKTPTLVLAPATVTGTVASTDDRVVAPAAVTLTITDDDTAGVAVDTDVGTVGVQTGALALMETGPGSGTYTVVLGTEPTEPVTVKITSSDGDAVSRAPRALTFGTTTWATAQTVVATAVTDADAVDERVALTHTLTGAVEYEGSAGPPGVAAVPVAEDGATTNTAPTYTVVLDSEPTAPVVVRIGSDNSEVHVMPGLLQYTASSWATAQAVTVRADADADARGEAATLRHTAAGGDYTGLAEKPLPVTVTVTDASAGVEVSRQGVTVVMGETNTYTIVLAAPPAGPVTGVAVIASLTLNHRVDGYGGVTAADSVSVVVAATGARLLIDPQVLRVLERGPSGTYTVRLATDPTGTVTVGAASNTNNAVSVSGAPVVLTFTGGATGNWGTAQPVTVEDPANTVPGTADDRTVDVNEVEDLTPTLGAVAAQTYRAGQAVNVRLPGATGGNPPLENALTGPLPATDLTLPAGLAFAAEARRRRRTR